MLLAIDSGNTNTLFAIHNGKTWMIEWRIATNPNRTADEYAVWFHQLLSMQNLSFDDNFKFTSPRESRLQSHVTYFKEATLVAKEEQFADLLPREKSRGKLYFS